MIDLRHIPSGLVVDEITRRAILRFERMVDREVAARIGPPDPARLALEAATLANERALLGHQPTARDR